MKQWWMVPVAILFVAGCASMQVPGCSSMKPQVCSLIEKGIAAIDSRLGNPDDVLNGEIKGAFRTKSISDLFGQVQDYWNSLSTDEKLALGKDLLTWLDVNWCGAASGEQKGYQMSVRDGVLAILRGEKPR